MPRKTPAEKSDRPTVLAQEEAAEGFEEPEMEMASLETASPVSASELQGSLARQLQNMMAVMHTMQSSISGVASLQAKMDSKLVSIDSRLEAVESQTIRTDAQNYGIPASTTETKHGNTRYDTRSLSEFAKPVSPSVEGQVAAFTPAIETRIDNDPKALIKQQCQDPPNRFIRLDDAVSVKNIYATPNAQGAFFFTTC